MLPILLKLGPITIRMYGVMVVIGFLLALRLIMVQIRRRQLPQDQVLDLVLYMMLAGFAGARFSYVIFNLSYYAAYPFEIFKIWQGGLVFYGGFVAALGALYWFCRKNEGFSFWAMADLFAPAVALGHTFGRIGCFCAGCCYGLPTNAFWGVKFFHAQALAPLNLRLHPTQLYEAGGTFGIFVFLYWLYHRSLPEGEISGMYLFLYGLLRFHIEFLRGDDRGGYLIWLSPSQWVALLSIAIGIGLLMSRHRKQLWKKNV